MFAISRCLTPCDCHLIVHSSIALAALRTESIQQQPATFQCGWEYELRLSPFSTLFHQLSWLKVTKKIHWQRDCAGKHTSCTSLFYSFITCLHFCLAPNFFVTTHISLCWETLRSSTRWPSFIGFMIFYRPSFEQISRETCQFRVSNYPRFHTPIVFWFSRAKPFHRKTINIPIWQEMLSSSFPSSLLPKGLKARWARRTNKSQSTINLPILKDSVEDMSCRTGNELLRRSRVVDFSLPTYHRDVIGDGVPSFFSFPNRSPDSSLCSEAEENFDLERPRGCQHLGRPGDIFCYICLQIRTSAPSVAKTSKQESGSFASGKDSSIIQQYNGDGGTKNHHHDSFASRGNKSKFIKEFPPFGSPSFLPLSGKCKAIAPRQEEEQENRLALRAHQVLFDDKLSEDIWLDCYHDMSNPTLKPKKEDGEEGGNFDSRAHVFDASEDTWLFAGMNYPFELAETRRVPLRSGSGSSWSSAPPILSSSQTFSISSEEFLGLSREVRGIPYIYFTSHNTQPKYSPTHNIYLWKKELHFTIITWNQTREPWA